MLKSKTVYSMKNKHIAKVFNLIKQTETTTPHFVKQQKKNLLITA